MVLRPSSKTRHCSPIEISQIDAIRVHSGSENEPIQAMAQLNYLMLTKRLVEHCTNCRVELEWIFLIAVTSVRSSGMNHKQASRQTWMKEQSSMI